MHESQLPEDKKQQLLSFLGQHRSAFAKDVSELSGTNRYYHTIYTGDGPPIRHPQYRSSPKMQEIIDKEMKVMEENDIIEPSTSDWASPVVLVRKKNNTWRFTVDYSHLNNVTANLMQILYGLMKL